jgi:hypothetical protein
MAVEVPHPEYDSPAVLLVSHANGAEHNEYIAKEGSPPQPKEYKQNVECEEARSVFLIHLK